MTIGERIEQRRKALGIASQSELARRADMRQSTLNGLIRNPYRWSPYLVHIARALHTTVEYLTGDTDNPDEGAAPAQASPSIHHVMLPVALPSENALARMFEGLLRTMDLSAPVDEVAHELATLLPIGLSQLRGLLPTTTSAPTYSEAVAPALASDDREPRP